jgi:hypothetical protein
VTQAGAVFKARIAASKGQAFKVALPFSFLDIEKAMEGGLEDWFN